MSKKIIRQAFRDSVFKRDKYICRVCGKSGTAESLDAHHITDRSLMPNGGYIKENGITVCKEDCHMKCELYHISDHKDWTPGLHPDDLYKKIGSSFELAYSVDSKM